MEVTLASGTSVKLASVLLEQADAWIDAAGTSGARQAGRQLCVDALNNAGGSYTVETFNRIFTPGEFIELQKAVLEASGLASKGEAAANV